jgi:hypothetical protein
VGGDEIDVPKSASDLARVLSAGRRHDGRALHALARGDGKKLLVRLFAMGALRF